MTCQDCGENPATVHVTQNINGEHSEVHLCAACAQARGLFDGGGGPQFSLQNLLAGLLGAQGAPEPAPGGVEAPARLRCGLCGLSYRDFARQGRLGCSQCYREFESQLEPLLRRIHGSTRHRGKVPGGVSGRGRQQGGELERLRSELEGCVRREDFERAAQIRDRIRELERKGV